MPLNQFAPVSIHRNADRLTRLRRPTLNNLRAVNKNVAAFLRIDDAQLTNLCPVMPRNVKQSSITDLPTHLRIERRAIDNDIDFARLLPRQDCFDNRFRLEKIVSKKFRRLGFELAFFNIDGFLLLGLARAVPLLIHQLFEACNIHSESALARHQFSEIERKPLLVVKPKREFASEFLKNVSAASPTDVSYPSLNSSGVGVRDS